MAVNREKKAAPAAGDTKNAAKPAVTGGKGGGLAKAAAAKSAAPAAKLAVPAGKPAVSTAKSAAAAAKPA
ncbi:MAG: hypothetical protein LBQ67_02135, partial [Treponema sp.]|nr:hypothetical protein [Treponema sp.]